MNNISQSPQLPVEEPRLPVMVPQAAEGSEGATESILRRYWRILLKRRWIVIAVIAVSLVIGLVTAMLTQREYSAVVTMEIARQADKVVSLGETRNSDVNAVNMEFYQTQYTLLKSRSLAEAVVRDLRLADDLQFLTNYTGRDIDKLKALPRKDRERAATGIVMEGTEVIPVRLSAIVNVRYSSPNPEMAAKVANSIARNFIQENLARRYDATAYARTFLQNQLEERRQKLEDSERQLVAYASREGLINLGAPVQAESDNGTTREGESLATADLTGLNSALIEARARRVQAESRYQESQRSGGNTLSEVATDPVLNSMRERRALLQAEYQKQAIDFGPDYPSQVALRQQIQELDRQIVSETRRVSSSVAGAYRSALQAEQALQARVDALKGNVQDVRRRSIQYNIFQREVDTNRAIYNSLLQQFKEIDVAGGVGTNNVAIVDAATPPGSPFKPSLRLNLLLALLIGTILGCVAALVIEQLAESAILPEEFQSKLGIPLLGTIPLLEKGAAPIDVLKDRKAAVSEAYFSVFTGLQFVTTHGMPRTLFVTSTQPSEGKSTTALALAMSTARVGRRTLLIDADMRNPSVHRAFGAQNGAGLSNVLVDDKEISEVLNKTELGTLFYMTAGHIPPNPAELLTGGAMRAMLASAIELFDNIVVDGPPVMGLADAPLLGAMAESTVFILETGRTRTTQARRALSRLNAVNASVVGAVLTKFDTKKEGYGYGYGYEYSYGR